MLSAQRAIGFFGNIALFAFLEWDIFWPRGARRGGSMFFAGHFGTLKRGCDVKVRLLEADIRRERLFRLRVPVVELAAPEICSRGFCGIET